jgi:hypothetical protein
MMNSCYISFVKPFTLEARNICDFLTANGWPAILSNDINPGKEWPNNSAEILSTISQDRIQIIQETTWFLVLMDHYSKNPLVDIELGIALVSPSIKMIGIVGTKHASFDCHKKVTCFSNWDNFVARMFVP